MSQLSDSQLAMLRQVKDSGTALGSSVTRSSLYRLGLLAFTVTDGFRLTKSGESALDAGKRFKREEKG